MRCNRCDGETKQKRITSKKDGKQYTVFECLEGCKNGKYAYSFFPPRPDGKSQPRRQEPVGNDLYPVLFSIGTKLDKIIDLMTPKDVDNDPPPPFEEEEEIF